MIVPQRESYGAAGTAGQGDAPAQGRHPAAEGLQCQHRRDGDLLEHGARRCGPAARGQQHPEQPVRAVRCRGASAGQCPDRDAGQPFGADRRHEPAGQPVRPAGQRPERLHRRRGPAESRGAAADRRCRPADGRHRRAAQQCFRDRHGRPAGQPAGRSERQQRGGELYLCREHRCFRVRAKQIGTQMLNSTIGQINSNIVEQTVTNGTSKLGLIIDWNDKKYKKE